MEFLHASIALLASMVLVLAGMVGWLYWQQTRLFQNMNSMVMVIGELARPPEPVYASPRADPEETEVKPTSAETVEAPVKDVNDDEDDRVSVDDETSGDAPATVSGPPAPIDVDSLEGKKSKELRDMLSKRGIPFNNRDSKPTLISLLKAVA
jgi:beta-lactam-binding protein with PASTA domain